MTKTSQLFILKTLVLIFNLVKIVATNSSLSAAYLPVSTVLIDFDNSKQRLPSTSLLLLRTEFVTQFTLIHTIQPYLFILLIFFYQNIVP